MIVYLTGYEVLHEGRDVKSVHAREWMADYKAFMYAWDEYHRPWETRRSKDWGWCPKWRYSSHWQGIYVNGVVWPEEVKP